MTDPKDVKRRVKELLADVSRDVERMTQIPEEIEQKKQEIEHLHDEYAAAYKRAQDGGLSRAKLDELGVKPPKRRRRPQRTTNEHNPVIGVTDEHHLRN